jgi:peptide-methionine (R)-S-oxide reductase
MNRRGWLQSLLAAGLWSVLPQARAAQSMPKDMKGVEALQKGWKTLLAEGFKAPAPTDTFKVSKAEWKKRLSPQAYDVLREEGTERAGTSPLNQEKRDGVYVCAGCELPVFTSAMKYESGTGWPSFFTTIPGVFETKRDFKLFGPRIEYHCKRCGGHHGHVFEDGPPPTGQRWCNNGVALRFVPRTGKA